MLLLAAGLRLADLDAGWFGVDQARDVAWAEQIASGAGHPVVGPLMRNRFHLGAIYYDFWALPAFFAATPRALYQYAALLGVGAVALTWLVARRLAGRAAGLAAAALLASSPVAVIDARIAWAPAALPIWTALLLLLATAFVRRPSRGRAAALLATAALGTQLHVAAAPLALVAGVLVLLHARALGLAGLALAAVAGVVPLLPMLATLGVPVPAVATPVVVDDPRAHRLADLVQLTARVLTGLAPAAVPPAVRAFLPVETALTIATALAALALAVRPPRGTDAAGLRTAAALLVAAVAAVAALPAEAWYYYLDSALVPGAVLLGVALASLPWQRAAVVLAAALVACRVAMLAWWITTAAGDGYVSANLDYLRIGGPRPADPDARARLLGVATKTRAADVLVRDSGIPAERLWHDVHGSGFGDLDTDNGYFLRRAVAHADDRVATPGAGARDAGASALVTYRDELPAPWLAGFAPPTVVGPLEIRSYAPAIDLASARLEGCSGALPAVRAPAPLDYGSGEPPLPAWPCAAPTVVVPVRPAADGVVLRVFARTVGAARVAGLTAEPAGTPLATPAPGAGVGLELAPGAAQVAVRLDVSGPARLDLYELHGLR